MPTRPIDLGFSIADIELVYRGDDLEARAIVRADARYQAASPPDRYPRRGGWGGIWRIHDGSVPPPIARPTAASIVSWQRAQAVA